MSAEGLPIDAHVVWAPQPKQAVALAHAGVDELFYGGAKGGGKSDFLLIDFLRGVEEWGDAHRGVLFRRTYPELEELIIRSRQIYPFVYPEATWRDSSKSWTFPSGAMLRMRFLERSADVSRYQGHQYTWIGWDELPQWPTPHAYVEMLSCARSAAGAPIRIRSTGNPGCVGNAWVKRRFISPAPAGTVFRGEDGMCRMFVSAKVYDNAILMRNDPHYVRRLEAQSPEKRAAYLEGDWDVFAGQALDNWDPRVHVVKPFEVDRGWRLFRCCDWGFSRPFSVYWYALDFEGRMVVYREWYGWSGVPNEGARMEAEEVAQGILSRELGQFDEGRVLPGPIDTAAFNQTGTGPSVAQRMARHGVVWTKSNKDRVNGFAEVYQRLSSKGGGPKLVFFQTCRHAIRTLPELVHDDTRVEDVDTDGEDHAYDAIRYACMSAPLRSYRQAEIDDWAEQDRYRPLDDVVGI